MNPYETLGVPVTATTTEIRSAYRALVKKFHPDAHNPASSSVDIARINEAYDILSDPAKRRQYDLRLRLPDHVIDEDPREVYRRERAQRKAEAQKRRRERAAVQRANAVKFMRPVNIAILAFALVLVVDEFLPGRTHEEIATRGWQERLAGIESAAFLYSFMQTQHFSFAVPDDVREHYDYRQHPSPITIRESPIFRTITNVSLSLNGFTYKFQPALTVHSLVLPIDYLLLLFSVAAVGLYQRPRPAYAMCFVPVILLAVTLVFLFL